MKTKNFYYLILLFVIPYFCFTQNDEAIEFKQDFIVFSGCEGSEEMKTCFEKKYQDFILKTIKKEDLAKLIQSTYKDTLTLFSYLEYDKRGRLLKNKSNLHLISEDEWIPLKYILKKLPIIKPPSDIYGNIVSIAIDNVFGFKIDKTNQTLAPIYDFEPTEMPYGLIKKIPVYKDCFAELTNEELRQCTSNRISELFAENFNLDILYDSDLPTGLVRIYLHFTVDKNGEIKNIKTNMTNKKVKKETFRVIKLIPKFKTPGIYKDKPVSVPFSLPILFSLER